MNNCLLMAEIVQSPQLRYTSDNQTPVAEFVVQFPGLKEGDPSSQMKVVGWGNLAQDIQAQYHAGQRVLLEGRLAMNVVDSPQGYKEKQVEMTVQRIYAVGELNTMPMAPPAAVAVPVATPSPAASRPAAARPAAPAAPATPPPSTPAPSYDDIPF
ncbi:MULTISPECIES: single-stranded DNA-binding protein [Cyanophyceae]|uniref:Single-stranded DNA-binding protein n=1 Tax=Leptolyngbya subtilissima DQ-A4 TaxID=2933933 RepID=A0ABV0K002_9CYAN|nr:single-stranded DNA-binding protein [Nodosilinea sp. FACHB-141]MBD2110381.1 single-stranded DNA-binding protein [Nodosilinea sp. FACHB-141]